ncbi:hypothetical protein HBH56_074870 [Parastagonospora nodorum]|uniref:LysM domain-containing protein n=1 Tax=Phaeosphaeria nodorum (strain SN15 / ATCC MYA-4574 / FGSC 10173) TaxID=321614 RepID=A0A7U2IBL4_PHANO|nr:hypothetical protein HBH56_074870 [Parastagonospora nodorum]QRD06798.1 hypothetical protein JI435_423720 [Parastagonospora nodorum SN15]KAH3927464.1 hypothetical protein HBH54_155110 [Parastagonospora nodorum]KAH3994990.1 hypothetical protein HBI10_181760 [Parastagonospora nodorum]KAH4015098.1 hypothetical protein HBI13_166890 [Parastagonospora nodorum]
MLATVIYVVFATAALASHIPHMRRGPTPKGIVDPGAHPGCTIWHDNLDGSIECPMMTYFYNITPEQLLSWNPTLTEECGNYQTGHSYCVEVDFKPSQALPAYLSLARRCPHPP